MCTIGALAPSELFVCLVGWLLVVVVVVLLEGEPPLLQFVPIASSPVSGLHNEIQWVG